MSVTATRPPRADPATLGDDYPVTTPGQASRFLAQATFGPTPAEIDRVVRMGYAAWMDEQLNLPPSQTHFDWLLSMRADNEENKGNGINAPLECTLWRKFISAPDQVRTRTAFALSEIFVISMLDGAVGNEPRAVAAWLDMLGEKGFTTYRELLEAVSLHPMMGLYLSHLRNQKADLTTGTSPDENYAREVMQLFSIGLIQRKQDFSPLLSAGVPVPTYTQDIITSTAKVFTGFTYSDAPTAPFTVTPQEIATSPVLSLSLDRSSGVNGERLHLTITRTAKSPQRTGAKILLYSSIGAPTSQSRFAISMIYVAD